MNVAFKEWSIICDTLGCGNQSLILRKGGIHEGKKGFRFEHEKFALFPTRFHEQEERVRIDSEKSVRPKTEYQIGENSTNSVLGKNRFDLAFISMEKYRST